MECSLRGKEERPSFSCETFLSLFSRLSKFTLFSSSNQFNYQLASEPNRTKPKEITQRGIYPQLLFSLPPKKRPHQPLPPSLIKNRKSHHFPSPIPQITFPLPKKREKKNSQPQLRLLIPPHIRLLSTPLTHLQTPPFAFDDPCAETMMIGVVAGEMTMFDETAT